jgi:hypothetical protein
MEDGTLIKCLELVQKSLEKGWEGEKIGRPWSRTGATTKRDSTEDHKWEKRN